MSHSWKNSRSGWTVLWPTWSNWRYTCSLQGLELNNLLQSKPSSPERKIQSKIYITSSNLSELSWNFSYHLELQMTVAWMQICLSDFVGGRIHVTEEGWVQACLFSGVCYVIMKPLMRETGYRVPFSVPTLLSKLWQKQLLLELAQKYQRWFFLLQLIDSSLWGDVSITRALCLGARWCILLCPYLEL